MLHIDHPIPEVYNFAHLFGDVFLGQGAIHLVNDVATLHHGKGFAKHAFSYHLFPSLVGVDAFAVCIEIAIYYTSFNVNGKVGVVAPFL